NGAGGVSTLDLNNNSNTIASLSLVAGGNVTTGTGVLTLGGDVTFTGAAGTGTINGNLNLGTSGRNFNIARGNAATDVTVAASITGGPTSGAALSKTGPGILRLSGTSTFGGGSAGVLLSAGTLQVSGDAALGNAANGIQITNASSGAIFQAVSTFSS